MGPWDSPDAPRARDASRVRNISGRTAREWFRRALNRVDVGRANVIDDACEGKSSVETSSVDSDDREEELRHLRRHVEALTVACADAEARARMNAVSKERLDVLRRENANLKDADEKRSKAETRAKAAEARANAARDALVHAAVRHEEALKKMYEESEATAQKHRVEIERLRSEACVMTERLIDLERVNEELEVDLAEYREETAHLDEVIAQHEDDLARVIMEKHSIERELAAKSAASIKSLIMSPFSPKIQPESTPRLAAAMRWFEDVVVSPMRSTAPFADLTNVETVKSPMSSKSRLGAGHSPLPKTPGAVLEDSAEDDVNDYGSEDESVGAAVLLPTIDPPQMSTLPRRRTWKLAFSKDPVDSLYGRPLREIGALRLRVVGSVSLTTVN